MRKKLTLLSLFIAGCGNGGSGGGQSHAPVPSEEPPEDEVLQFTDVPAAFYQSVNPEGFACVNQASGGAFASESDFTQAPKPLDRGIWDWDLAGSPSRIHDDGATAVHLWRDRDSVYLGIATPEKAPDAAIFSFYGIVETKRQFEVEKRLHASVQAGRLLIFDRTGAALGEQAALESKSAGGVRTLVFAIPLQQLGDVLYWPNIAVTVQAGGMARPAVRFFEGLLQAAGGTLTVSFCNDWLRRLSPHYFTALLGREKNTAERGTQAAAILREAIEDSTGIFGKGWSMATVPVLLSDKAVVYRNIPEEEERDPGLFIRTHQFSSRYFGDDAAVSAYAGGLFAHWRYQLAGLISPLRVGVGTTARLLGRDQAVDALALALTLKTVTRRFDWIRSFIFAQGLIESSPAAEAFVLGWGISQSVSLERLAALVADRKALLGLGITGVLSWLQAERPSLAERPGWVEFRDLWNIPDAPSSIPGGEASTDADSDGLPDLLEVFTASDPGKGDTDDDSWNDYAEVVAGSAPDDPFLSPKLLIQDGNLNDWYAMLPTKIQQLKSSAGPCGPKEAVNWYGAIAEKNRVLIAFNASGPSNAGGIAWNIGILVPAAAKSFQIRLDPTRGQEVAVVAEQGIDAQGKIDKTTVRMNQGQVMTAQGVELALDPSKFGIKGINLLNDDSLRIQVTLVKAVKSDGGEEGSTDLPCSATPQFSPISR